MNLNSQLYSVHVIQSRSLADQPDWAETIWHKILLSTPCSSVGQGKFYSTPLQASFSKIQPFPFFMIIVYLVDSTLWFNITDSLCLMGAKQVHLFWLELYLAM